MTFGSMPNISGMATDGRGTEDGVGTEFDRDRDADAPAPALFLAPPPRPAVTFP